VQRRRPPLQLPFFSFAELAAPALEEAPVPAVEAPIPDPEPAAISVGELDRRLKRLVEGGTADVRVEGEISNLKQPASGHSYFTLKDETEDASIDAVMYRTAPARSRRLLVDGARVVLVGRATVYAPRGKLQLLADSAQTAGRGAILEALERLKARLSAEGLFAPERKRPLPAEPRVIGVVTSADGAAIHDIAKVAFRRAPVRILLAPAAVQGAGAALSMARALALLARVPEVEAIILGRGGGSADDLAAFNDEQLVRQVAACRVPVVSAVGHEIDVTLTDLAADARAATPSQAAELLVPDAAARAELIDQLRARLARAVARRLTEARATLEREEARLGSPDRLLAERRQGVDEARERLAAALRRRVGERRAEVARLDRRLASRHPSAVIAGARGTLGPLSVRLGAAMRAELSGMRRELSGAAGRLDALSPLAVLGRGYAIATGPSGRAVVDAAELRAGDAVVVRVHRGSFTAQVSEARADPRGGRSRD
jgi:exodeoxyribonuclease VII large subunit